MTPNPLVAMAAPAPETRYAPREMPRAGSRKEGQSFEERLNLASAKSKPGSTSKGVAESKSQGKPEAKAEASTQASSKEASKVEDQAKTPEANVAPEVAAPAVPVSELSSVAVMTALPVAQTPAPEVPEEGLAPQAVVQAAVAEGTEVADPALTAVVAKALEPQAKPETAAKADAAAKPAKDSEEAEPEVAEVAKTPVAVKPIARQSVPSSLEGLRAEKGLMSLRESLDGAPRTETAPALAKNDSRAMPAHLDEVKATVIEEAVPQASTVKPWEITEPVRVVTDGTVIKTDSTLKAEPVPVKEAITRTFVQVHKTPDRPAELRLQLNPEHLGRMEVRVHAHEGAVSAVIRVEHAGVRDMVENQLAALRTSLAEQGIKVDRLEVSVNQQGPRDQQAAAGFEFGRQSFGQDGQRESSGQANQGQAQSSGWEAWSLEEPDEAPVPETESGFDAQA